MPRLKEDRIKSRLTQQSTNIPIVNQDEAYEIKLVDGYVYIIMLFFFSLRYLDFLMVKHSI